jgi:leader peptidase (prepilin peptidase)/N-methyltransferase
VEPVTAFILIFAALFGVAIGSFLNVVAYRVPAKVSLVRESRCPACDAPIRAYQNVPVVSWIALRGRCANCKAPIAARYPIVEAVTGAAFVLVTWWVMSGGTGTGPSSRFARSGSYLGDPSVWVVLVAYLYFVSLAIVLTLIDLDVHRLPNSIVLPAYPVTVILFTVACLLGADWSSLLRAAIGGAAMYVFYFIVRLISPRGMGGGDVKLAGVIGLYLGWVGWSTLVVGAFAAFLFGGVFGILLIVLRRAGRKTAIPFGPWMLLGAWAGLFTGALVGRWYLGLYS